MTKINLHGALADKYGESFSMEIGGVSDVFDAIDANRDGFKKTVCDLHSEGFDYAVLVNKKNPKSIDEMLMEKNPKVIDLVPVLQGDGASVIVSLIITVISTVAQLLLAPDPPKPPEISQRAEGLTKSFTFSNTANRSAQGTPVPVCYGELIVGSEVIQATFKSFPQSQKAESALTRNPFNVNSIASISQSSQIV